MIDINFLSQRRVTLTKVEKKDRQVYFYTLGFFSVCLLIFLIVFGVGVFYNLQLKKTTQQQQAFRQTILNDESTEIAFLVFANKLKSIKSIFETRSNKQHAIGFFSELFGPKVFIGGMSYDSEGGLLSLQSTSNNVFTLEETFSLLDSQSVLDQFNSLSKSNLTRVEDGSYSFQLTVGLKKEVE